jgi:2,3-bisphosphoglycerate-dependent phosphoglycerate mutase
MVKLILLRHGQSRWNELNLFTGWVDIPLSKKGIQESVAAGRKIADLSIDVIYTSALMRAEQTAMIAMLENHSEKVAVIQHEEGQLLEWSAIHNEQTKRNMVPIYSAWQINERMYGDLQGLNKAETVEKYGEEQVQIWRRSFDGVPPGGESLAMTAARSIPYFESHIVPSLKKGENVLVVAHGNSLRSIIMHLEGLSKEEVVKLELATGVPVIYDYKDQQFHKINDN